MMIPNKFNGYRFDGTRSLYDPASAAATVGSTLGSAAVPAATGVLETGIATGAMLASGVELLGTGAGALSTGLGGVAPVLAEVAPAATAQSLGTVVPELAQATGLDAVKQQVISQGMANQAANQATNLGIQNAVTQNMAANVVPEISNIPLEEQLAQIYRIPTDRSKFPQYEKLAGLDTQLVEKVAGRPEIDPFSSPNLPEVNQAAIDNATKASMDQAVKSGQVAPPPVAKPPSPIVKGQNFLQNLSNLISNPSMEGTKDYIKEHPYATAAGAGLLAKGLMDQPSVNAPKQKSYIRPYDVNVENRSGQPYDPNSTAERSQIGYTFTPRAPYEAGTEPVRRAVGGPVEQMSAANAIGANTMYPQSQFQTPMYSNPMVQRPMPSNVVNPSGDAGVDPYTGEARFAEGGSTKQYTYDPKTQQFTDITPPEPKRTGIFGNFFSPGMDMRTGAGSSVFDHIFNRNKPQTPAAPAKPVGGIAEPYIPPNQAQQTPQQPIDIPAYQTPEQQLGLEGFYGYMDKQLGQMGGYAAGGVAHGLGGYSDGGRLLKGPGDGVSDSIPAVIGHKQPARLADGEFVIPARIVSELGNGSTEAGARKLYAMMDRVQKSRGKTTGKGKIAVNSKADKHLPA